MWPAWLSMQTVVNVLVLVMVLSWATGITPGSVWSWLFPSALNKAGYAFKPALTNAGGDSFIAKGQALQSGKSEADAIAVSKSVFHEEADAAYAKVEPLLVSAKVKNLEEMVAALEVKIEAKLASVGDARRLEELKAARNLAAQVEAQNCIDFGTGLKRGGWFGR